MIVKPDTDAAAEAAAQASSSEAVTSSAVKTEESVFPEEQAKVCSSLSLAIFFLPSINCHCNQTIVAIVLFTPHVPVFFGPSCHNFGDIVLKFCIWLSTSILLINHLILKLWFES